MTATPEQQLCVRCGHIRSIHADGMNECLAYHESRQDWTNVADAVEPCSCPAFVAAFNEAPPA